MQTWKPRFVPPFDDFDEVKSIPHPIYLFSHSLSRLFPGLLMGLDERSRAADSLASMLAVYDGFCNLKQVRPSLPNLTV